MKKIVASTALAALLAPYAGADTTVVTAHEEPAVVVEQAPEECCTPDFGGISFILGIGGSFMKAELKNKDKTVYTTFEKSSKNVNRFIGTIGLGGGKVFKNVFYVGAEVLFDFTKNKEYTLTQDITDASNAKLKSNGLFTSLGLRLGYIMPKYNTMIYFKVSGSHSTAKARIDATALAAATPNVDMKASKIVPTLALGVEKAFCKKFTARLEGEYRFKSTKKDNGLELKANDGFNIRALVSYNVRF